jgi:agmatinase
VSLEILSAGVLPVLVGGEHSITIGGFRGFARHYANQGHPLGLLSFDSHLDTGTDRDLTAASPITRAIEAGCSPDHIAIVGIHGSLNPRNQLERARSTGVTVLGARDVENRGIASVVGEALDVVCADGASFYVTFDFDSIDPAYAPGVVTPEPGGLTSRELLEAARLIGAREPGMFDLVEMAPVYDLSGITSRLACALITNLLGALAESRGLGERGAEAAETS